MGEDASPCLSLSQSRANSLARLFDGYGDTITKSHMIGNCDQISAYNSLFVLRSDLWRVHRLFLHPHL
jgi:hypothetical protein